jgi:hypothetical protein
MADFFRGLASGFEFSTKKVGVRHAGGMSQGNLHLQTCLQRRSCGPAEGRSNPSRDTKHKRFITVAKTLILLYFIAMSENIRWVGVSGSWRNTSAELEVDLKREVTAALERGDGIVTGGALNVDYTATELALLHYPDGSHIKVLLPTTLEVYVSHYRKRADEGVITHDQAEKLIQQLKLVNKLGSLIVNTENQEVTKDTYYLRNTEVVNASDELLAFQVNESAGTQDTIDKAHAKGIPVKVFQYTTED